MQSLLKKSSEMINLPIRTSNIKNLVYITLNQKAIVIREIFSKIHSTGS